MAHWCAGGWRGVLGRSHSSTRISRRFSGAGPSGGRAGGGSEVAADITDEQAASAERQRGVHNEAAVRLAKKYLADLDGLSGVLQKMSESWRGPRRAELREKLLAVFPKTPSPGVCYRNFYGSPRTASVRGNLHPTMLSNQLAAFDLFLPYEQDFLRELQAVWDHGFTDTLRVTPFQAAQPVLADAGDELSWSLFAWGPDGSYKDFVNASVLVWLSVVAAQGELHVPAFLVSDLCGLSALYEGKSGNMERSIGALRVSMKDALTARTPDPMMIDHMLENTGMGSSAKADTFVKRYNSSVFFDKSLMLRDHAETRQSRLLDTEKISRDRKKELRDHINSYESFAASALNLEIMNSPLFWAASSVHPSTNPLWAEFGTTTEDICTAAFRHYVTEVGKLGGGAQTKMFITISKRNLVAAKLRDGIFKRKNLGTEALGTMLGKILRGTYDEDVNSMLQDTFEVDEHSVREFDEYIMSQYSVVEDALELATTMAAAPAETGTGTEGNKETASSANMSDCDWAIRELEDSLKRFSITNNNFALRGEELKRKEAEYDAKARSNAAEATKNFSEKAVKFMPHVLDKDRFLKELPAILQDRVQEISVDLNTSPENVLVCFFADLTSQGAPTISVREEIDVRASVVCGKAGLAIIMASDTPSTKGRPTPKKASRGSAVGAPAVGAVAAAAADGAPPLALEGLPAVDSSNQEYKDRAQTERFLSKDFANLFNMGGSTEDRYCEPVVFKRSSKHDLRALAILPSDNSPWQATKLISTLSLPAGDEPSQFVDAGPGAAGKARRGEITWVSSRSLSSKLLRYQRGTAIFKNLFDDLARAVEAHAQQTQRKTTALWVNLYSWVGDDAEASACQPCVALSPVSRPTFPICLLLGAEALLRFCFFVIEVELQLHYPFSACRCCRRVHVCVHVRECVFLCA